MVIFVDLYNCTSENAYTWCKLSCSFWINSKYIYTFSGRPVTEFAFRGVTSKYTSTGISAALPVANYLQVIIKKYPEIVIPFSYTEPVRHNAEHKIKTTRPPVYYSPRRLRPKKKKLNFSTCYKWIS